jgi:hypothetical protein
MRTVLLCCTLLMAPTLAAAQDAERLALANQIIAVQGDMSEQISRGFNIPLPDSVPQDQQQRFRALLNEEMAAHKADFMALMPQVAALWARTFTAEELRQMIGYYGSPAGKAIIEKELNSGMGLTAPVNLSSAEATVYKSFKESAAGKAIDAHRVDLAIGSVTIAQPLMMTIAGEMQAKRCVIDDSCPKAP